MEILSSKRYNREFGGLVPVEKESPEGIIINRCGMTFYKSDVVLRGLSAKIQPHERRVFIVGLTRLDKVGDNKRFVHCIKKESGFKTITLEI